MAHILDTSNHGSLPVGICVREVVMQVPSNLVLIRLGPRVWLPIIIVAWGVVATLFAGLKSATDFYVLRLLLGVAESGSFPGASPCVPIVALYCHRPVYLGHARPKAERQSCCIAEHSLLSGLCGMVWA